MTDIREDFVNYVVKALVTNPDAVQVHRSNDEKGDYLELKVDPADMGKVIGKAGATAKSLRTLLRVVGAKDDLNPLPLKIVEPDDEFGAHREPAAPPADDVAAAVPVEEATPEDIAAAEAPGAEEVAAEEAVVEEAPVEEATPEETETTEPEAADKDRHAATKKEMEELADFEV